MDLCLSDSFADIWFTVGVSKKCFSVTIFFCCSTSTCHQEIKTYAGFKDLCCCPFEEPYVYAKRGYGESPARSQQSSFTIHYKELLCLLWLLLSSQRQATEKNHREHKSKILILVPNIWHCPLVALHNKELGLQQSAYQVFCHLIKVWNHRKPYLLCNL